MAIHHERAFEDELCEHLAAHGWLYSPDDTGYDVARALYPADLFGWLNDTQPEQLAKVADRSKLLDRLVTVLDGDLATSGGTLHALRRGFATGTSTFTLAQPRPTDELNPTAEARYRANRVRVVRQVHYSAHNRRSLDLVFFLNGLPVATVELKTDFTQSSAAAVAQYQQDRTPRDPVTRKREPLLQFGTRALVHFAVSNTDAQMTTRLDGGATRFLPFNLGRDHGAGNPDNPHGSATSYLWERVWQRDAWLQILLGFVHLHAGTSTHPVTGLTTRTESLLFPRYHQWEVVTRLVEHARVHGAGQRYLVQHSAGSGKSNSIAWAAHQLSTLHRPDGSKAFRSVIVVTDRTVLDDQLRETIRKIDAKAGVVVTIGDGPGSGGRSKSAELTDALTSGAPIITVTIQTFPYVGRALTEAGLTGERFAIIADEAHSSQSGATATELRRALTGARDDEDVSTEDVLAWVMAERASSPNISYFAFTATPKNKTMELFGTPDADGTPQPFHLYSMHQAIEEHFILDVLASYTTYDTAFRLAHNVTDAAGSTTQVDVDSADATRELMRWVRLHPTNISQKVRIVVEHFRANVAWRLDGRAKAMVVTGSRKEAVRYKLAMDTYIREQRYDVATLVAFSGSVDDPGSGPDAFTEGSMNADLRGRTLPTAFASDEFSVMIVAAKFQTGFDQPLLVAMYVDKRLSGVTAVQTLSRLNRTAPGKDTTYVLDFVNDETEVLTSFRPYYEQAALSATTDPDLVHDLRAKLDSAGFYTTDEVDAVVRAWLEGTHGARGAHEQLEGLFAAPRSRFLDAWDRAVQISDAGALESLELFRKDVDSYVRLYDFLSQIINYANPDLEKRSIFLRLYSRLIRTEQRRDGVDLSDVVLSDLAHHPGETRRLDLGGEPVLLDPLTAAGSGTAQDPKMVKLAEVIARMNEVFDGGAFNPSDIGSLAEHVARKMLEDPTIARQVRSNSPDQVAASPALEHGMVDAILGAQGSYTDLTGQLLGAKDKRDAFLKNLLGLVYILSDLDTPA